MRPDFDKIKATEATVYLLNKGENSELYLIHALKMLYIAERRALQRWGRSITWDRFVSMDNGPVLSRTYNLMSGSDRSAEIWDRHISDRSNHKISIAEPLDPQKLSLAELKLLDEVFHEFGHVPRFDVCDHTHKFPEWKDPDGSSLPIEISEILKAADWTDEEIQELENEHESRSTALRRLY